MNYRHDTTPTLPEDRVRRLRELLIMMVDRYGEQSPVTKTIRRNLSLAEAARSVGQDGRVQR